MDDKKKIDLLKEHARNERYKKEPIANALIAILVKKGILSHTEAIQIRQEFDQFIDNQVDIYFRDLEEDYDPE